MYRGILHFLFWLVFGFGQDILQRTSNSKVLLIVVHMVSICLTKIHVLLLERLAGMLPSRRARRSGTFALHLAHDCRCKRPYTSTRRSSSP